MGVVEDVLGGIDRRQGHPVGVEFLHRFVAGQGGQEFADDGIEEAVVLGPGGAGGGAFVVDQIGPFHDFAKTFPDDVVGHVDG